MEVRLQGVGKKFRKNWVFKKIDYSFKSGGKYAILGHNGSGKSTLIQIISGLMLPSQGSLEYYSPAGRIDIGEIYNKVSIATPYMVLFEELTLKEQLEIHMSFRKFAGDMSVETILAKLDLVAHADNVIEDFSSGMRQRVKLGLALMTQSSLVLLDEPLSNLDENGRKWYHKIINEFTKEKTVIVCSNKQEEEYYFCTEVLSL